MKSLSFFRIFSSLSEKEESRKALPYRQVNTSNDVFSPVSVSTQTQSFALKTGPSTQTRR